MKTSPYSLIRSELKADFAECFKIFGKKFMFTLDQQGNWKCRIEELCLKANSSISTYIFIYA